MMMVMVMMAMMIRVIMMITINDDYCDNDDIV